MRDKTKCVCIPLSLNQKNIFSYKVFSYNASPDKKLVKKLEMIKDVYV